jgi:hypothetical protein
MIYSVYDKNDSSAYLVKYQNANDQCEKMKSVRCRDRPTSREIMDHINEWTLGKEEFNFMNEMKRLSKSESILSSYFFSLIKTQYHFKKST